MQIALNLLHEGGDAGGVGHVLVLDRDGNEVGSWGNLASSPHGIWVNPAGEIYLADTGFHTITKHAPTGELLLAIGTKGQKGPDGQPFNMPTHAVEAPNGDIFVSDGHSGQNPKVPPDTNARIVKFTKDGKYVKEWGKLGSAPGEFRTPHALAFDSQGRLWVADRGNHRIEIFDQEGNYLESRYMYGRISGLFMKENMVYAIDSESSPESHPSWRDGIRIGPVDSDYITAFIPPFEREDRVYQGTAGEGIAVDADGNVYAAEGPNSLTQAGGAFTKYSVK